jgi:serine/threonine-protein kinase
MRRVSSTSGVPPDESGTPGEPGTPLGQRYVLHEILGRGAMGQVYRATVRDTGEEMAAKVLRPELSGDANLVARFLQERVVLTAIDDPHVVPVRDLIADSNTLAIITELVRGPNLRKHLSATGTLTPADAVSLTVQVLWGLAAVHDQGVIHRDVKPENVLLDTSGAEPVARLTDFGIARLAHGPSLTRVTGLIGTPDYLPPELAEHTHATPQADVYSAGIMLYELLCGVTPFAGGHAMAVLKGHTERRPGRIPGVPDELWEALAPMLAKEPGDRPSAQQAADALTQLIPRLSGVAALPALDAPPPSLLLDGSKNRETVTGGRRRLPENEDPDPDRGPGDRRRKRFVVLGSLAAAALVGLGIFVAALVTGGRSHPTVHSQLQALAATPGSLALATGQTAVISLTGTMTDGTPAFPSALVAKWQSSGPDVASVVNGTVKALAVGSTTVTASVGTLTASVAIIVVGLTPSPSSSPPPSVVPTLPSPSSSPSPSVVPTLPSPSSSPSPSVVPTPVPSNTVPPASVAISPESYGFHLQFPHSGKCIDVPGSSTSNGTQLDQYTCVNQTNEQWHFHDVGGGYYQIRGDASNKCMDIADNSLLDSAKVIQGECGAHDSEYFRVLDTGRRVPFTYYLIQNVHSGKCLNVEGHSLSNNAKLIQWTCSNDFNNEQTRLY